MSGSRSLTPTDQPEYDLIASAMTESARGRWFLEEFARRNRTADTEMLLGAIERLQGAVTSERETVRTDRMRGDLMDMARAIARTKAEISAIGAPDHDRSRLGIASVALDAIVRATEQATSDILSAAEHVQETAWTLRESGSDSAICDALDQRATQIYTACSFQDLTAQRTARIIQTLRYLEERLAAMIAIWGDEIAADPSAAVPSDEAGLGGDAGDAHDLSQSDVDRFIDMDAIAAHEPIRRPPLSTIIPLDDDIVFLATPDAEAGLPHDPPAEAPQGEPEAAAVPAPAAKRPPRTRKPAPVRKTDVASAFADIDGLSAEEKLALFS